MDQITQARQALSNIGYQINAIGVGGRLDPQQVKQALQSLANAVTALMAAVEQIEQRTKK
ncbi:MAG: hypothetical protein H7Z14_01915, partial [Anaerolineae bacterium]|nr:hypothetical protein [Phycisphaerae bacterium]